MPDCPAGWWRYDERTNIELEEAYSQGETSVVLLIAGHNYDINFGSMTQVRSDNSRLSRRVKRDMVASSAKGTAGLTDDVLSGKSQRPRRGRKRKLPKDT